MFCLYFSEVDYFEFITCFNKRYGQTSILRVAYVERQYLSANGANGNGVLWLVDVIETREYKCGTSIFYAVEGF